MFSSLPVALGRLGLNYRVFQLICVLLHVAWHSTISSSPLLYKTTVSLMEVGLVLSFVELCLTYSLGDILVNLP